MENVVFTKVMRKATRDVHDLSDALVNAKLALAGSSDAVWAEGLLIFYEIFRFLEEAMDRLNHSLIGELDIEGMRRSAAFEEDLAYYLGKDWHKDYKPREAVADYVTYLRHLESTDPYMLMAYVYHLYMGLLSGGQILQKKRQLLTKLLPVFGSRRDEGYAITKFGDVSISHMKRELAKAMNSVAEGLDQETRDKLVEESRTLFIKNNQIIKTVRGANQVLLQRLVWLLASVLLAYLAFKLVA